MGCQPMLWHAHAIVRSKSRAASPCHMIRNRAFRVKSKVEAASRRFSESGRMPLPLSLPLSLRPLHSPAPPSRHEREALPLPLWSAVTCHRFRRRDSSRRPLPTSRPIPTSRLPRVSLRADKSARPKRRQVAALHKMCWNTSMWLGGPTARTNNSPGQRPGYEIDRRNHEALFSL